MKCLAVWLGFAIAAIALGACASGESRDVVPLVPVIGLAPGPELAADDSTFESAADAILLEWVASGRVPSISVLAGGSVRTIDPGELAAYRATLSPDGGHAAVSVQRPVSQVPVSVQVIELPAGGVVAEWATQTPHGALWHPDGSRLLVVEDACEEYGREGACETGWQHRLWSWEFESGGPSVVGGYDFWLSASVLSPDGATLYGLGSRSAQCCGIAIEGAPFLAAIDTTSGALRVQVALPDLVLGQRTETRDHGQFGVSRWPALAIAPDSSRAYVAHAEDDRITMVDLDRMEVARSAIPRFARSPFERFGGWLGGALAGRAEAKGGLYFAPQVLMSPDGSRLYVTGVGSETCVGQEWFPCLNNVPMGLRVIDARTLDLRYEVEGIALSPDGTVLAGTAVIYEERLDAVPSVRTAGLVVLDTRQLGTPVVIRPGVPFQQAHFSVDGEQIYAIAQPLALTDLAWPVCVETCHLLSVFHPDGRLIGDHVIRGGATLAGR